MALPLGAWSRLSPGQTHTLTSPLTDNITNVVSSVNKGMRTSRLACCTPPGHQAHISSTLILGRLELASMCFWFGRLIVWPYEGALWDGGRREGRMGGGYSAVEITERERR